MMFLFNKLNLNLKQLPLDWQMLYLGGNLDLSYGAYPIQKHSDNLFKLNACHTTHAFSVNKSLYEKILKNKDSINSVEGLMHSSSSYVVNIPQSSIEKSVLFGGKIELDNGLLEVSGLGTGFMLIQREVFKKMKKYYDNDWFLYKDEKVHLFFDTAIEEQSREYLSEDYFFTRRWLNLGGFTWIDPTVSLVHTGYYRFNGGSLALDSIELEKNKEESVDE